MSTDRISVAWQISSATLQGPALSCTGHGTRSVSVHVFCSMASNADWVHSMILGSFFVMRTAVDLVAADTALLMPLRRPLRLRAARCSSRVCLSAIVLRLWRRWFNASPRGCQDGSCDASCCSVMNTEWKPYGTCQLAHTGLGGYDQSCTDAMWLCPPACQ